MKTNGTDTNPPQRGFSFKQVIFAILASMAVAIFCTGFAIKIFLFPSPFKPVELSNQEESQLAAKLDVFEGVGKTPDPISTKDHDENGNLIPVKYSEEGGSRQISFSERELNSMISKNTDLADKLAVDLSENLISIKLLLPLAPDFPVLGGKTLKVRAGAELAYLNGKPIVKLKGVSVMGVPMPNSWLGNKKNLDLVKEYGGDNGFWQGFSEGVESINVMDGFLNVRLKE